MYWILTNVGKDVMPLDITPTPFIIQGFHEVILIFQTWIFIQTDKAEQRNTFWLTNRNVLYILGFISMWAPFILRKISNL